MNRWLLRNVNDEEVKKAASSVNRDSSQCEDGFSGNFYHHFWHVIGADIVAAVSDFFKCRRMLHGLNHTLLALIPKGRRPLMHIIISPNQSAFIKGRLISDNILIAHELTHHLNCKQKHSSQELALKLDLSKVYDRVEWKYLRLMLHQLGFHAHFIELIMQCVETTSFSTLMESNAFDYFRPERSLHQGDPLSPLLFVICMEGLTSLILQMEL
ncbi:hypothetical protein Cni_G19513 [Canna indica]|uniref:Reverse transcriptase domain-containing protein n=1 Tax=Canna indica TaxID=4628 RepID=A0AAQ3QH02_9LILI|nr:hypothetical protein Cni_G19513 [Canna indica]